jgi:tetratricopeptide (TPR) repeat protein
MAMPIPLDQLPAIAEGLTKIIGLAGLTGAVMDTEGFAHHLGARLKSGKHNERKINFARAFLETDETIPEESKKWIQQRLNPSNKDMKALFAANSNAEVRTALIQLELIPNQDNLETHHQTLYDLMCNALFKEGDAAKRVAFIQESMRKALNLLHTLHSKLAAKTKLEVRSKTWDKDKHISPSRLLQPEYQTVDFKYRETEIQDLNDWLQGDGLKIRLYTAAGGTGKTRLFQEWCRQKQNVSWQAGFFKPNPTDTAALLELDSPLIIVIDYAESEQEHLIEFLKTCEAQISQRSSPIRVVLLEREKQVLEQKIYEQGIDALDSFKVIALKELSTTRENIYIEARAAFSEKLTGTPFHNQTIPDLSADVYNRVLMIHIRALLDTQPLPLTSDNTPRGLLDAMLDREYKLWDKNLRAKGMGAGNRYLKDGLRDALAMTTLGHHSNDRANLEQLMQIAFPDKDAQTRSNLADVLATTHPNGHGGIEALQPDLLGERLVQLALEGSRRDAIIHALFCNPDMPVDFLRAFTVISRLSGWQQEAGTGIANAIEEAITKDDARGEEMFEVLVEIVSTVLIQVAVVAGKKSVAARKVRVEAEPHETNLVNYARTLGNLSNRLRFAGDRVGAYEAATNVNNIFQELASTNPQKFNADLAMSLNALGTMLRDVGQVEKALIPVQEAVRLNRELAKDNPQVTNPNLAMSLNNLGGNLHAVGRFEDAVKATQEARDLYRELARVNPQTFNMHVAVSLIGLGILFKYVGRPEDALAATQDGVKIYRHLTSENPQNFKSDLASSLSNLAIRLGEFGRLDEAIVCLQEAVSYHQELARDYPQAFSSELARSLNILGDCFKGNNRLTEAHSSFEQAFRVLSPFFIDLPDAFVGQMVFTIQDYLDSCQVNNLEPDTKLVDPILQKLKEIGAIE